MNGNRKGGMIKESVSGSDKMWSSININNAYRDDLGETVNGIDADVRWRRRRRRRRKRRRRNRRRRRI